MEKSLSKHLYVLSSVILFLLLFVSVARFQMQKVFAGNPPKELWVDGRVYALNGDSGSQNVKHFASSESNCGTQLESLRVSGHEVDKCDDKSNPYYLIDDQKEGENTYVLELPALSQYSCDSWVAVKAENTDDIIASGKCTGENGNEAVFDNNGENVSLWWKLVEFESRGFGGASGNGQIVGAPDSTGFDDDSGIVRAPETNMPDLVPFSGVSNGKTFSGGFNASDSSDVVIGIKNIGMEDTNTVTYGVLSFLTNNTPASMNLNNANFFTNWYNAPGYAKSLEADFIQGVNMTPGYVVVHGVPYDGYFDDFEYACLMVDSRDLVQPNGRIGESNEDNNISCVRTADLMSPPAQFSCANVTEIPRAECEALVALYDSTNGNGWTNKTGWKQTITPCSWFGVFCTSGNVTLVRLNSNNLVGTIPAALQNLSSLKNLDLYTNQLEGTIPREIGNLRMLEGLVLHHNRLTGSIPSEIGTLPNLRTLGLSDNQLSGNMPAALGSLSQLENLNLSRNRLTGPIPTSFGALDNLLYLFLSENQLTGNLPSEFASMAKLKNLYLNHNQLTGGVNYLGGLSTTENIFINDNQFSGQLPISLLGGLVSLKTFYYGNNSLCVPGGATGQMAIWLNGIENQVPNEDNINPDPVGSALCQSADFLDLIPHSGSVPGNTLSYVNGVAFTSASNSAGVAVRNTGNTSTSLGFNIKGVIVSQPITSLSGFQAAYAGGAPIGITTITGIGANTNNNPKAATLSFVTDFSQYVNQYVCILVDGDNFIPESNNDNNIGCRQIPASFGQQADMIPHVGVFNSNNYIGGLRMGDETTLQFASKNIGQLSGGYQVFKIFLTNTGSGVTKDNFNSLYASSTDKGHSATDSISPGIVYGNHIGFNAGVSNYSYACFMVDADFGVTESNENNNVSCVRMADLIMPNSCPVAVPTNISSAWGNSQGTTIRVNWTDVSSTNSNYDILLIRDGEPGSNPADPYELATVATNLPGNSTTYLWNIPSGLQSRTYYRFLIRAKVMNGNQVVCSNQAAGGRISRTQANSCPVDRPTNVSSTWGNSARTSIRLNWTDVSSTNTSYDIILIRDGVPGTNPDDPYELGTVVTNLPATATTYTWSIPANLQSRTYYRFLIRANVYDGNTRVCYSQTAGGRIQR